jgi:Clr5 domain
MRIESFPLVALQLQLLRRKNMAKPPTAVYITNPTEWEYLQPIITKLYIDEDWELSRVIKEIETKCGFKAT